MTSTKRAQGLALLVGACVALGCGEAGSLPDDRPSQTPSPAPGTSGGDPGTTPSASNTSLWPLGTGSQWTYKITDDLEAEFEKNVTVLGVQPVPESGGEAIAVRSVQPHLEELSWQLEGDGIVVRVREEDSAQGSLLRVSTWQPGTVKAIASARETGWVHEIVAREVIRDSTGGTVEDRDKSFVWRVTAVNVTVTVPAGTFTNAIQIERDRPDKVGKLRTYWLVPGVGKVRETGERTEELLRYEIR